MRSPSILPGAIAKGWRLLCVRAAALALVLLMCCAGAPAYSVLTHEEIVDLLWTGEIRPLLLKKYPGLTEEQIKQAHAYAYGGAVIQDLRCRTMHRILRATRRSTRRWQLSIRSCARGLEIRCGMRRTRRRT